MKNKTSQYQRAKNFLLYSVLQVNDSPHRLALGLAVGMFVAMTPTIPLQMILTVFLSVAVGANRVVGLPMVWISNPVTMVPIYYPQYLFGCHLLGVQPDAVDFGILVDAASMPFREGFIAVGDLMQDIAIPLFWGSAIISTITAVVTYLFFYYLILWYRKNNTYAPSK